MQGCLRGIGVRRDLLRVYATDVVTRRVAFDARGAMLTGGGGTDMRRGIADALDDRPTPDLVVVITDGFTPWPGIRPARPVVVALLDSGAAHRPAPPPAWATVVEVDLETGVSPGP